MAAWYAVAGIIPTPADKQTTRGCLGKARYPDRHRAELARIALYNRPGFTMGGDGRPSRLDAYHCGKCDSWHLGRDPRQTFRPRSQP